VGSTVTLPAGGRGIDQTGDGSIGNSEGIDATSTQAIISGRDGRIQTAADLMQLVQVIESGGGMSVPPPEGTSNGTSSRLDPSRIYFIGASLSSQYGAPFLAVEPDVKAGVLNTVGGPGIEIRRLRGTGATGGGESGRPGLGLDLAARVPSLLNTPGVTKLGGLTVPPTSPTSYFDENMPLRDGVPFTVSLTDGTTQVIQSPVTNTVAGAMAIQQLFDNREWVYQPGSPVAYAPYLRKEPLTGVPAKSVIVQFGKGDQSVENPTTTAFLRAGDLADVATYYRHDLAFADNLQNPQNPPMLKNPHTFLGLITSLTTSNPTSKAIAFAAQQQIATFFASDGARIIQPQPPDGFGFGLIPEKYFELLTKDSPLPEGLNYIV